MGLFTDGEVWTGGFYELALEYGTGAAQGLIEGARSVWNLRLMEGCYLQSDRDPEHQRKVDFVPSLLSAGHLYGVAIVPNGTRVACGTCSIPEIDGSEWLILYCPMSALGRAYPVGGFPFDRRDHESWRRPLEDWFAAIGHDVFKTAPFRLGLVGFEVAADVQAAEIASSGIPEKRYCGVLLPTREGLAWHPRTETNR
jgi:hypothetical protein